jgi:hypothetical protein
MKYNLGYSYGGGRGVPQNLLFAFSAALASYLFLGKPLMRLRRWLRTLSNGESAARAAGKAFGFVGLLNERDAMAAP